MAARVDTAAHRAGWTPFPPRPGDRSTTVLGYDVPGGSGPARERLRRHGIEVSSGYGPHRDRHVRVACFLARGMVQRRRWRRPSGRAVSIRPGRLRRAPRPPRPPVSDPPP